MKFVPRVMLTALICAAITARLNADPTPSQTDPSVNPHALEDPDGVPLQVTNHELFQPSKAELEQKQKADEKAKADKDWLLRGYEQQKRSSATGNQDDDFINRISSD